jgi:hypothetical protein
MEVGRERLLSFYKENEISQNKRIYKNQKYRIGKKATIGDFRFGLVERHS